jgi:hypothetical protein
MGQYLQSHTPFEEPEAAALEAHLRAAPKLVAPEPGMSPPGPLLQLSANKDNQNTVQALSRKRRVRETPVKAAPTNPSAHRPRKAQILTSLSSQHAYLEYGIKYLYYLAREVWASRPSRAFSPMPSPPTQT